MQPDRVADNSGARSGNRRVPLMCLIVLFLITGCDEQILHDLAEQDANRVVSRLSSGNLPAKKVAQSDGRWAISVSKGFVVKALTYLETTRVLSPRGTSSTVSTKGGFVPSRDEQRFRYERSVALSIEDSLGAMRGVLEARVHLNLPENDPLFGTRKESSGSGSVLLVTDSDFSAKDEEVAALVSGAAGIPAAKVSVLRSRAERQISDPLQVKAESAQPATDLKPQGDAAPVVSTEFSAVNRSAAMLSGVVIIAVAGMTCLAARVLQSRRRKVLFPLPSGVIAED